MLEVVTEDQVCHAMNNMNLEPVVAPCSPITPPCNGGSFAIPPASLRYASMTAEQQRAAILAILSGHPDVWGAWSVSLVRVVTRAPPPSPVPFERMGE